MAMMLRLLVAVASFSHFARLSSLAFVVTPLSRSFGVRQRSTSLGVFDKLFEESGPLGKGITVGKIQVALACRDRGPNSIFGILEEGARSTSKNDSESLGELANRVCLALLRKSDDWVAACSTSQWFKGDDYGKAESLFNDWVNKEATKFEKVGPMVGGLWQCRFPGTHLLTLYNCLFL
jgi:hypothetical protein